MSCPESGTGWARLDGGRKAGSPAGQSVCGVNGSQFECVSAGQKQARLKDSFKKKKKSRHDHVYKYFVTLCH